MTAAYFDSSALAALCRGHGLALELYGEVGAVVASSLALVSVAHQVFFEPEPLARWSGVQDEVDLISPVSVFDAALGFAGPLQQPMERAFDLATAEFAGAEFFVTGDELSNVAAQQMGFRPRLVGD